MKHLLLFLCLAVGILASAQTADTLVPGTRAYHYKKSKENKTGAFVMLVGGTALTATAIAIAAPGNVNFDDLGAVVAMGSVGAAIALGSIPVFNAAAKHKRKAATASVLLQQVPLVKISPGRGVVTAFSIKVGL